MDHKMEVEPVVFNKYLSKSLTPRHEEGRMGRPPCQGVREGIP